MIAIDGPVASGKSSIGKRLADRLGYLFFDTGVMYRAVTYLALAELGSAAGEAAVTALARQAVIDVLPPTVADGRDCTILVTRAPAPQTPKVSGEPEVRTTFEVSDIGVSDASQTPKVSETFGASDTVAVSSQDITWALRGKDVENSVSLVAAMQPVRQILTEQMRRVGLRGRVVMVGRDVGTVILPEADLKIFLTASVETRARRRFEEVQARGERRAYDDILANLRERDRIDSSRAIAPLRPAADALQLDTTDLSVDEVIGAIEAMVAVRS
jgi:cytidylate kinase